MITLGSTIMVINVLALAALTGYALWSLYKKVKKNDNS
jgi:hypothetical protein